jgi:uncharacterized repeat protein (TIGR01451 family)
VRYLPLLLLILVAALAAPAVASADADLSVTKTDSPDPASANADITYTITVTNNGPDAAASVQLTDDIPSNTTFVSAMQSSGPAFTLTTPAVGGTGTVTATTATLAAGQTATFSLVVNVNEDTPPTTTIFNTADVSSATADPNTGNNGATAATDISPQADLSVTKDDDADPVLPGDNITYTVVLNNTGPNTAHNVVLSDPLPPGTTFVSASQAGGASFTLTTPAVGGTGTVTATRSTLASADGQTFTIVVKVGNGVPLGTTLSNTASASSDTPDPASGNDSSTETTEVNQTADLGVAAADSPDPVAAGGDLTYTLTVSNTGPAAAQSVSLSDAVPAGTTFVSASQTSGPSFTLTTPAAGGGGTFTATRSSLASGASAQFTMVVRVADAAGDGSSIANTATVDGSTFDPDSSDDSATTGTAVTNPARPAGPSGVFTPLPPRKPRLTIGATRMRLPSGVVFVPLTCEFSPNDVCITDVTITFNTRKHKLDPITVKNVHIGSGQSLDLYAAASHKQRRKMRRLGTIPVTVTATNPPEADESKAGLLKGNPKL